MLDGGEKEEGGDGEDSFGEDPTVCFCHDVRRSRILQAVREGARTIEEIRERTCANTGCGGCELDVLDILEEEAARSGEEP